MTAILLNKHANHDAICAMLTKVHLSNLPVPVPFTTTVTEHEGETDEYQVPLLHLTAD